MSCLPLPHLVHFPYIYVTIPFILSIPFLTVTVCPSPGPSPLSCLLIPPHPIFRGRRQRRKKNRRVVVHTSFCVIPLLPILVSPPGLYDRHSLLTAPFRVSIIKCLPSALLSSPLWPITGPYTAGRPRASAVRTVLRVELLLEPRLYTVRRRLCTHVVTQAPSLLVGGGYHTRVWLQLSIGSDR